jgi:hypothetical protein
MKTLLYLEYRQLANMISVTLRTPKRLIPMILIVLWFGATIVPNLFLSMSAHRPPFPVHANMLRPDVLWIIGFMLLTVGGAYNVVKSLSESTLIFSLPEIDFLFPTTISRRLVVALKLLKTYAVAALVMLFLIVVFLPSIMLMAGPAKLQFIPLTWFSLLLYFILVKNASITINLVSTYRAGGNWWLTWVVRMVLYGLLLIAFGSVLSGYMRGGDIVAALASTLAHPISVALLLPARWTADLAFGMPAAGYGLKLAGLCIAATLSCVLVLSRRENPYESSLQVSIRAAAMKAAVRSGGFSKLRAEMWKYKHKSTGMRSPVRPFGKGAAAVIWKNIATTWRASGKPLTLIPVLAAAVLVAARAAGVMDSARAEGVILVALAYMLYLGSAFMANSLRGDLKQVNMLKPIPIPAWRLVAAETVHGTAIISLLAWSTIGLVWAIYGLRPASPLILAGCAIPFVAHSSLCSQLPVVILYPSIDELAHRYIGGLVSTFAQLISIGPPIVIGLILWHLRVSTAVIVPILACLSLMLSTLGIALGTLAYRRFDPTSE